MLFVFTDMENVIFWSDDKKTLCNKCVALTGKKTLQILSKTAILYVLKTTNVKPPKVSLDAMIIMKLAGGIVGDVLVKDYAAYKKWINEWYNKKVYSP